MIHPIWNYLSVARVFTLIGRHAWCAALLAIGATGLLCAALVGSVGYVWAAVIGVMLLVGIGYPSVSVLAVEVQITAAAASVVEEEQFHCSVHARRRFPWPTRGLRIQVGSSHFASLSPGTQLLKVSFPRRGWVQPQQFRVECDFPAKFFTAFKAARIDRPVLVFPKSLPCERHSIANAGDTNHSAHTDYASDGDILHIREYRRGDSQRQIAWQATARMGRLMARQRAAASQQHVIVDLDEQAFMGCIDHVDSGYEHSIRTAAGLVRVEACVATLTLHIGRRAYEVRTPADIPVALSALAKLPHVPDAPTSLPQSLRQATTSILLTTVDRTSIPSFYTAIVRFSRGIQSESSPVADWRLPQQPERPPKHTAAFRSIRSTARAV